MEWIIVDGELQNTRWSEEDKAATVRIPEGVEALWQCCLLTFDGSGPAPDIHEVIIPGSVRRIDPEAFGTWEVTRFFPHLRTVRYQGTLKDWCEIRKGWSGHYDAYMDIGLDDFTLWLLDDEGKEYPAEHLVFPEDITEIGAVSFTGCSSLKSAEIRGNVEIGALAFRDCRNLKNVTVSGGWMDIPDYDRIETGDQFPFDDTEELEVILSDGAAESLIARETPDLQVAETKYYLADRPETLGEILELTEEIRDEYVYKYRLSSDISPIRLFREYLRISRLSDAEESALYAEREGEEDDSSEGQLPEGYHEDTETELSVSLRQKFRSMKELLKQYSEALLEYVAFLKNVKDAWEVREREPDLPDIDLAAWTTADALNSALYEEEMEDPELSERLGPVISWIEDLKGLLEDLQDAEGDLWDEYNEFCDPEWHLYSRFSPEGFLKEYIGTAEYLMELCANCLEHMKTAGL